MRAFYMAWAHPISLTINSNVNRELAQYYVNQETVNRLIWWKNYSSEIHLLTHAAQLLNSLSINKIVMIKASKTKLKIQDSKLKLTSVAGFPLTINLWFETGTGNKNWL